jgi:hypothetical protein
LRTLQMEGIRKEDYLQELKGWDRNDRYVQELCTALLRSALQFPDQQNIRHNIRLQFKPRMIRYLVEKGADPNSGPEDAPIWITALDKFKIREESIGYNKRDVVEVFSILKGAVPALKLPVGDKVDEDLIKMFGIGVACTPAT